MATAGGSTTNKSYEDVALEITYRCNDCETGVMLRKAPLKNGTDESTGLYLSLSGPNSPAVYRLTLDKQGKEVDRKLLAARAEPTAVVTFVSLSIYGSSNRDGHYFAITDLGDGWQHLHFMLRGSLQPANLTSADNAFAGEKGLPVYGQLALHVQQGEVRLQGCVAVRSDATDPGSAQANHQPGLSRGTTDRPLLRGRNYRRRCQSRRHYGRGVRTFCLPGARLPPDDRDLFARDL